MLNSLKSTLFLFCIGGLFSLPAYPQGTVEDYNRAYSLREKYNPGLVLYSNVVPHWVENTDVFWYIRNTTRGKEYVKIAKGKAEDGKVAVRNIRRKAKESLDKAIKDGDMGEDEGDRLLKELDKVTKQTTDELDALLETKQKEIMEV